MSAWTTPTRRPRVFIASPFAGNIEVHRAYAREALLDSILRNEAGFASHLLYPIALDDHDLAQRNAGIDCGITWLEVADLLAVYTDLGISPGMTQEIKTALALRIPIEQRSLPSWGIGHGTR